jgi:hypothetical protein
LPGESNARSSWAQALAVVGSLAAVLLALAVETLDCGGGYGNSCHQGSIGWDRGAGSGAWLVLRRVDGKAA